MLVACASCGCRDQRPVPVADALTTARAADGSYIAWKEHRIDDEEMGLVPIRGGDGIEMGDLDQDGFADIVSVHADSSHIRLAFGSRSPGEWFLLTLGEGREVAAEDVAIGDLNRDGFPDIVAACEKGRLIYFQNPGGAVRGWRWPRAVVPSTARRGSLVRVWLADLNRGGAPEVIAVNEGTGAGDNTISWFEVPANPLDGAAWKEHEVAQVSSREHVVSVLGTDVMIAGSQDAFHDFNLDGRLDVVTAASRTDVIWLERPDDPAKPWQPHPIGALAPDEPAGIALADINGDGRPDVLAGGCSRGPAEKDGDNISASDPVGRLAWFESPASPSGKWNRHDILRFKRGKYEAFLPRDMDGDGDIDFVATRGNSGEYDGVFWLEQVRSKRPSKAFTPARKSESERLPIVISRSE